MPTGRLRTTAPHLWPIFPDPYPSTTSNTAKPHTYKNRRAESVHQKQGFLALDTDDEEEEYLEHAPSKEEFETKDPENLREAPTSKKGKSLIQYSSSIRSQQELPPIKGIHTSTSIVPTVRSTRFPRLSTSGNSAVQKGREIVPHSSNDSLMSQHNRHREEIHAMMDPSPSPLITASGQVLDDMKPSIERRTRSSTASRAKHDPNEPSADVRHGPETATFISAVPSRKRSSLTVRKTPAQPKKQYKRRVASKREGIPDVKIEDKPEEAALGEPKKEDRAGSSGFTRVVEISYDPNGLTRDVYVQGSRYMDGSIADPNPALEEHVATVLRFFMNPFLHNLTFRKTDPIASEFYLKDQPLIYRFRQVPHGLGHTYQRTRGDKDECLMWEDTVIITPFLILEE